jgi:hypothetical protein
VALHAHVDFTWANPSTIRSASTPDPAKPDLGISPANCRAALAELWVMCRSNIVRMFKATPESPSSKSVHQRYQERLQAGTVSKSDLTAERETILDLYKHHLRLLLEANVFLYAVTGALLSFVVAHLRVPHIRLVLLFSGLFDAMFAVFFLLAGRDIAVNERELGLISNALNVNTVPRLDALKLGLRVSSAALFIVAVLIACAAFLIRP